MNIIEWIKQNQPVLILIGPMLGGLGIGTLLGVVVKAQLDEKTRLQNWFEQTYVMEGLDKCIATLLELRFHFMCIIDQEEPPDKSYEVPMEAYVRVHDLLQAREFYGLFSQAVRNANKFSYRIASTLSRSESSREGAMHLLKLVNSLILILDSGKKDLIDHKIKYKSDVYQIHNRPRWNEYSAKIRTINKKNQEEGVALRDKILAEFDEKHVEFRQDKVILMELLRHHPDAFTAAHGLERGRMRHLSKEIAEFTQNLESAEHPFCTIEEFKYRIGQQKEFIQMYESEIAKIKLSQV